MAKKAKVELTLEELQAKKGKRQRGWVRFAAIFLAVVLTLGVYFGASNGGPNIVSVYPNIVRAQTQTVVQKQDAEPTDTDTPADEEETESPTTPSDDEGGILETLLGLLGSIDLSELAGKLNLDGLGIVIADGIQNAKDSLLSLIDQLESIITGRDPKDPIKHDAVEYDFEDDNLGSEIVRQALVEKLNEATQTGVGYSVSRSVNYTEDGHVNIGEQTDTLNAILDKGGLSLDRIVGGFVGMQKDDKYGQAIAYTVQNGQTAEEALAEGDMDTSYAKYGLMPTQLQADDIKLLEANILTGRYVFNLKNVDHPNEEADCGLTRFTKDYVEQAKIAESIQSVEVGPATTVSPLRLTDLETKYYNIRVTAQFDVLTGQLTTLMYEYESYGKFTVRTNTVQVVGCDTIKVLNMYSNFVY